MPDEGQAFNVMEPPKRVTDPKGTPGWQEFPKHLHNEDGAYVVVKDAAAQKAQEKLGFKDLTRKSSA